MTLFKALHPCADVDGLYVNCKNGGRGLLSIADVIGIEKYSLSLNVSKSKDLIMGKVRDNLFCNTSCDVVKKSTVISKHIEQWKNKAFVDSGQNLWMNSMLILIVGCSMLTLTQ